MEREKPINFKLRLCGTLKLKAEAAEEDTFPSYNLFFVLCLHLKSVILQVRDRLCSAV